MKPERLHIKEPERHAKHSGDRPAEKFLGQRITKPGKSRKTEDAEVSKRTQSAERNSANPGISAAENLSAISGAAANRGFSGQKHYREISGFDQTDQRDHCGDAVKNYMGARTWRCYRLRFHEDGFALLIAFSTNEGSFSGLVSLGAIA